MSIQRYKKPLIAAFFMTATIGTVNPSYALQEDQKLACEAVLCLSSGTRPSECAPSLRHYFSIKAKKPHKTIERRLNFLKMCPWQGRSDVEKLMLSKHVDLDKTTHDMNTLMSNIAHGAGNCDVPHLNAINRYTVWVFTDRYGNVRHETRIRPSFEEMRYYVAETRIKNYKPPYCVSYENHMLTDLDNAKYVGDPDKGYWIESSKYEAAQAKYEAEQKRIENETKQLNRWSSFRDAR